MTSITPTSRGWLETTCVGFFVALLYAALTSGMPVDDAARYVKELGEDRFVWDLAHIWMEPLALLIYRLFHPIADAETVLNGVNIAAVALGVAVFHDTLRRLGHGRLRSLLAVALVSVSFNLLALGPTAHIKLMVFPALALSLRSAVLWEQQRGQPGAVGGFRLLFVSGIWLGVGTNLLVSLLPMALFVASLIVVRARQSGAEMRSAFGEASPYVLGVLLGGAGCLLAAYGSAMATGGTDSGFLAFVLDGVAEKHSLHPGVFGLKEVPFRFAYSLAYNFVFMPELGGLGRAWLFDELADPSSYVVTLIYELVLVGLSLVALAVIFGLGLRSMRRDGASVVLAFGYILGAAVFALYHNLNDPEHWFQFTLPIVLIAMQVRRRRWLDVFLFAVWLPLIAINNLALYAVPRASIDMGQRNQEIQEVLGEKGLYVGFAAYPGEPDSSLLDLSGVERLALDLELKGPAQGSVDDTLATMTSRIDAALARGGRVLVFRALDPGDWRGPIMTVTLRGLTKSRMQAALSDRYVVTGPREVAGFAAWEVKSKPIR
jgi:hypothetical protein